MKSLIKTIFAQFGYEIRSGRVEDRYFDFDKPFFDMFEKCNVYTKTPLDRMYALYKAIEYICSNNIPGAFVECGVWKGGSCMLAAYAFKHYGDTDRKIVMYDTFEGTTEPTGIDVQARTGVSANALLVGKNKERFIAYAPLDEVKENMRKTRYPEDQLLFVKGPVEHTIPSSIPGRIALLRLDTDWYESTFHELKHLYPLLSHGGVIILDDYGAFEGARKAVDEYFTEYEPMPLLNRVDFACRIGVKCDRSIHYGDSADRTGERPAAADNK